MVNDDFDGFLDTFEQRARMRITAFEKVLAELPRAVKESDPTRQPGAATVSQTGAQKRPRTKGRIASIMGGNRTARPGL